jgi:hypothetical protein
VSCEWERRRARKRREENRMMRLKGSQMVLKKRAIAQCRGPRGRAASSIVGGREDFFRIGDKAPITFNLY